MDKSEIDKIKVGDKIPPYKVKIRKEIYKKYNRLINEINPLHFNKNYAQKLGFKDIVVAGNFTFSYIPKWLINWSGDISSIKKISVKFENPIYLNEEIIHKGTITKIENKNNSKIIYGIYVVEKNNGKKVTSGDFKIVFPMK